MMRKKRGATAIATTLVLMIVASTSSAQQLPPGCDAKLAKDARAANRTAYGPRGNNAKWCEGVFQQEVGNTELLLAAFTQPLAPIAAAKLASLDTLAVEWDAPPKSVVSIIARQASNPFGPYYQLNAEAATGANGHGTWKWPLDVLSPLALWPVHTMNARGTARPPAISVQAVTRIAPDTAIDVYLPVRISARAGPTAPGPFQVTMSAKERVTNLSSTVTRIEADGTTARVVTEPDCPGPTGGTVGGELVTFTICMPASAKTGLYTLRVAARSDAAMVGGKLIRFYYAADSAK